MFEDVHWQTLHTESPTHRCRQSEPANGESPHPSCTLIISHAIGMNLMLILDQHRTRSWRCLPGQSSIFGRICVLIPTEAGSYKVSAADAEAVAAAAWLISLSRDNVSDGLYLSGEQIKRIQWRKIWHR